MKTICLIIALFFINVSFGQKKYKAAQFKDTIIEIGQSAYARTLIYTSLCPDWDSTKFDDTCGYGPKCSFPDIHWLPIAREDYGFPVYCEDNAYLGSIYKERFVAVKTRGHLANKPMAKDLLDHPKKLGEYLKLKFSWYCIKNISQNNGLVYLFIRVNSLLHLKIIKVF